MRILPDECVPWPVRKLLPGHDCRTAKFCGWGGYTNGDLRRIEAAAADLVSVIAEMALAEYRCWAVP